MTTPLTDRTPAGQAPAGQITSGRRVRPGGATVLLGVLALAFAAYTALAMDLEWRSEAGRIGAGFFPRIIGTLGVLLSAVAALRTLRAPHNPAAVEDAAGEPVPGEHAPETHPRTLAAVVAISATLLFLLVPLGTVLTSAVFMFALLRLLGRGSGLVADLVLSLTLPLALYLLLEVWLEAGLPPGILPLS